MRYVVLDTSSSISSFSSSSVEDDEGAGNGIVHAKRPFEHHKAITDAPGGTRLMVFRVSRIHTKGERLPFSRRSTFQVPLLLTGAIIIVFLFFVDVSRVNDEAIVASTISF